MRHSDCTRSSILDLGATGSNGQRFIGVRTGDLRRRYLAPLHPRVVLISRICPVAFIGLLLAFLLQSSSLFGEPIAVRYQEGSIHGFLVLRTLEGKVLAAGDQIQTAKGDRVTSRLIFHFRDGSIDDETVVYSQHDHFRVISDHHVQKGPAFPKPMDVLINALTGEVTVRYQDKGKEKVETDHLDLPPDLANGIVPDILENLPPGTKDTKVSYVATTPKPRLVKLSIMPQGEDTFSIAGAPRKAIHFTIKVEIGGITGVVAPLVGKQPADINVWLSAGQVPAFVKLEGQSYDDGPIWRTEMSSPVWKLSPQSKSPRR
jgi:hypothetical protein